MYAIPGSIFDPLSDGCHILLQQGAAVAHSPEDVLQELGEKVEEVVQSSISDITENVSSVEDPILSELSVPLSIDELSSKTKIDLEILIDKLFDFQLDGKVRQTFSGLWELI